MITKVTIKGAKQAVQMFGPAQAAVAKAVADSVEGGVIPKDQAEDLVIVCGVFIHWLAEDDKKIYFVAETKDTGTPEVDLHKLSADEQLKIKCGKAHFREFDSLEYKVINKVGQLVK